MTSDNLPAQRRQPAQVAPRSVNLMEPLTDLDEALRLSDALSRSTLVPQSLVGKPSNIFHIIMTGQALDLHWTESIRVLYSPGPGQIGMRGSFLLSRLRKAHHTYSFEEQPDSCTFRLVRGDTKEKFDSTFTIEDAIKGGLARRNDAGEIVALSRDGKPLPWMAWTKRMLRWRAVSDCVSFGAPEVALGFEIEGTDVAEPQPEVVLNPQSPAPPGPDAEQAAPSVSQAEQAEQLAGLDQDMRGDAPEFVGSEQQQALADSEMGGNPDMGGNPQDAPTPPREEPASAGRKALEHQLAKKFTDMGWDPRKFKPDMLRACSMFCGRRITGVRDMTGPELGDLYGYLMRLAAKHPEDAHPVALADWVEAQREKFAETDPTGYAKYEEGK